MLPILKRKIGTRHRLHQYLLKKLGRDGLLQTSVPGLWTTSRLNLYSRSIILSRRHATRLLENGLQRFVVRLKYYFLSPCDVMWEPLASKHDAARHSFSICAYICSTADSVLDANPTDCQF